MYSVPAFIIAAIIFFAAALITQQGYIETAQIMLDHTAARTGGGTP